ncbi:MAG: hypothetical protein R6X02_27230 [Enhygromyxa sp.]
MTKHRLSPSTLTCGLLLLSAASLAACEVGFKEIGGEGETGDGDGDPGDGDGDPGDGDGDGDPGDGDGDPGDCPPAPQSPFEVEFDYQLTIFEDPHLPYPIDRSCTIVSLSPGTEASLEIDCPGAISFELDFTVTPGLELVGQPGDTVHVWLWHIPGPEIQTVLRLDFPEYDGTLFVLELDAVPPMSESYYFPAPWELAAVESCGPLDDGCAVTRPEQLKITLLGQPIAAWAGDYARADISEAFGELWVARAEEIVDLSPLCDPAPGFFQSYRLLIHASALPVEGEVCQPGESNPCATGLHCCYPCGIQGCDFVCTPEDPNTMECPPPPP